MLEQESASSRYSVHQFSEQLCFFLAQICPKTSLGLETQKANVRIRISILEILCVTIFSQNGQLLLFRPKFSQKIDLGFEIQKTNIGIRISIFEITRVPIFR